MKILAGCLLSVISSCCFGQNKQKVVIVQCMLTKGDSVICWKATEDSTKIIYILQQYRWKKWVNWDTIKSKNASDTAEYSVNISKYFHSNQNIFRINPMAQGKVLKNSEQVKHMEKDKGELLTRLAYTQRNSPVDVSFESETWYEVYDKFGNLMRHGYGRSFSRKGLPGDVYYVNYDDKTTEVIWYYAPK